jgi:hypothetical protein
VLYERASGILEVMDDDLRLALTQEPAGVGEVKVRFIGDSDDSAGMHRQRLMFVRAFEAGQERAIVGNSGDGRPNDMALKAAPDPTAEPAPANPGASADGDEYNGLRVGDFKALGGMAQVAYFVKNQTLYRAIRAPVSGGMLEMLDEKRAQKLSTDVLFLQFDYWGQETRSWDAPAPKLKSKEKYEGPQRIWDSTRGITAPPLGDFFLHRYGCDSLNDPEDDVFPQKVRITLTVDSTLPRCLFTRLLDEIGENDRRIDVDSVRGFADGDAEDSFLLIDDEWLHYTKKQDGAFSVDQRGARGTFAKGHAKEAEVRQGQTFRRVVYLPGWREDFMPDNVYIQRKRALEQQHKRVLQ